MICFSREKIYTKGKYLPFGFCIIQQLSSSEKSNISSAIRCCSNRYMKIVRYFGHIHGISVRICPHFRLTLSFRHEERCRERIRLTFRLIGMKSDELAVVLPIPRVFVDQISRVQEQMPKLMCDGKVPLFVILVRRYSDLEGTISCLSNRLSIELVEVGLFDNAAAQFLYQTIYIADRAGDIEHRTDGIGHLIDIYPCRIIHRSHSAAGVIGQ